MVQQDYSVNCIGFIITDGEDNSSTLNAKSIKDMIADLVKAEEIDSIISVLVGVNSKDCAAYLQQFKIDAGLTQYIDMGDVSPGKLAKLGGFISKSISSQSRAIGTGKSAIIDSLVF